MQHHYHLCLVSGLQASINELRIRRKVANVCQVMVFPKIKDMSMHKNQVTFIGGYL